MSDIFVYVVIGDGGAEGYRAPRICCETEEAAWKIVDLAHAHGSYDSLVVFKVPLWPSVPTERFNDPLKRPEARVA